MYKSTKGVKIINFFLNNFRFVNTKRTKEEKRDNGMFEKGIDFLSVLFFSLLFV